VNPFCTWLAAHGTSCIELVAVLFGIASVALSIPESVWNWPVGLINVLVYFVLFAKTGLYANAGLQLVYFVLSIYGWYEWLHGGAGRTELTVRRTAGGTWAIAAAIAMAGWVVLVAITRRAPGGAMPATDSVTVVVSLIAEWMAARKLLENWIVWILIDVVYVGMLVFQHLDLAAINYAVYGVLGVFGYRAWRKSLATTRAMA
jgi:nicotinamide mononucleotide transporter